MSVWLAFPAPASAYTANKSSLQLGAKHPETFTAQHISFTHANYIDMVRKLNLPFRAIEGTSAVGPFFWSALDQDDASPHLHIVFRKSDVRKKGLTRGWELMLSHDFRTAMTTGYAKGTESSKFDKIIDHLHACAANTAHPILLPAIIIGHELDSTMDEKQRRARQWLRKLEHAITDRNEIDDKERYSDFNLDEMNFELVECHSQVLWKRPQAFVDTLDEIDRAMERFRTTRERLLRDGRLFEQHADPAIEVAIDKMHRSMTSRFDFLRQKLKGIRHYAHTTISRLDIQRAALYNIIAQKESKLNLEIAQHQRLLALASKRDNQSMKALSIVGAVFLPATYLASLFSMTFFNFQPNNNNNNSSSSSNNDDDSRVVAPTLWIYFAITIPLTLVVLALLFWWDWTREKQFAIEENEVSTTMPDLERRVETTLREKRTGLMSIETKRYDSV